MRLILIFFICLNLSAQNNFKDEKEIVNSQLSYLTIKNDSVFLFNRFDNKLLYDWFRADKKRFDFKFASEEMKALLFEMAKFKDSIKGKPKNFLISSNYINNKKVYFLESNNNYIKSCKNNTVHLDREGLLVRTKASISQPFFSKNRKNAVVFYTLNGSIYYSFYQKVKSIWERKFNIIVTIS